MWLALQVLRQRSHVEHRQLPNRDTLSGIFLIGRWFSPSWSCRNNYLIRPGTTDCAQLSGYDPWEVNDASWTRIVFRRTYASTNRVGLFVGILLDCDNIFLAIFEHNRNTRSHFFSQTHFTSVKSGMWYSTLLTVQDVGPWWKYGSSVMHMSVTVGRDTPNTGRSVFDRSDGGLDEEYIKWSR